MTTRLAERFSSAMVVGIDRSKYLLSRLQRKMDVSTVLGDIPCLPFKKDSFDLVVTVQVLHDRFHFKGKQALVKTLQNVGSLLKKGGEFVIFDHVDPGNAQISV